MTTETLMTGVRFPSIPIVRKPDLGSQGLGNEGGLILARKGWEMTADVRWSLKKKYCNIYFSIIYFQSAKYLTPSFSKKKFFPTNQSTLLKYQM